LGKDNTTFFHLRISKRVDVCSRIEDKFNRVKYHRRVNHITIVTEYKCFEPD
jgi:hypothetical protein